eukprot:m.6900 g.6900  ORF g.6900 m.6900 type:complete len:119 (-) comp8632_c0_seq1:165-521(-)
MAIFKTDLAVFVTGFLAGVGLAHRIFCHYCLFEISKARCLEANDEAVEADNELNEETSAWVRMALQSQAAYDAGDDESGHMLHEAAKLLLVAHKAGQDAAYPTPPPARSHTLNAGSAL